LRRKQKIKISKAIEMEPCAGERTVHPLIPLNPLQHLKISCRMGNVRKVLNIKISI